MEVSLWGGPLIGPSRGGGPPLRDIMPRLGGGPPLTPTGGPRFLGDMEDIIFLGLPRYNQSVFTCSKIIFLYQK